MSIIIYPIIREILLTTIRFNLKTDCCFYLKNNTGHDVNRREPGLQRQMTAVHDRACGDRGLLAAGRTFPTRPATLQFPASVMAAAGADEAIGPSLGREVAGGGLIGKARLEAGAGQGAIMFPAAGHAGTLHEHATPGKPKPNMSSNRDQRDKPFDQNSRRRLSRSGRTSRS